MKTQSMLVALAAAPSALAHTVFTNFFIDGVSQGDGVAIRMNTNLVEASNPIASLESNDLACNVGGSKGVSRVAPIQDGSTLTFEIRAWPDDPSKERLDRGHKGPCAVYLKKVDSAIDDQGHGDGWFKIFDHGYDKDSDSWCTDKIIDNNGKLSVVLPKGLESGYYLARPEILALHKALENDPQFYTGCAQLFLEGGGNLGPAETVSIPGYVKYGQESTNWNIYYGTKPEDYPLPGPQIAKLVSKSASANVGGETGQTEGLKPAGCIVENANWCGKEVPDYSDEKGCWASTENCWDQADVCFKSAGPTGHKGCTTMQEKCQAQSDLCKSGDFNGPKNKGKVLTPKPNAVDVGELLATEGGGAPVVDTPKTEATQPKPTSATAAPAKTSAFETVAAPVKTPVADVEKPVPEAEYPTVTSKPTVNVPASEAGPAPTAPVCPEGYKCVTVYETVVKTEVVYSTVYNDYRRRSVQNRRRV